MRRQQCTMRVQRLVHQGVRAGLADLPKLQGSAGICPWMTDAAAVSAPMQPCGRDDAGWLVLFATCLAVASLQLADPFHVVLRDLLIPAGFAVLLAAVATFYRTARPDPKIVAMTVGLQQMTMFSAVGAMLSYMMAALGSDPADAWLAGWDHALGFDWVQYLHWINAHPAVAAPLQLAYESLMPQMVALIVVLGLGERLDALRTAILGAMLAGLANILISGALPAFDAYVHFGLTPADYPNLHPSASFVHMKDVLGLRDGSLRTLSLTTMQGIITFPSYHSALAIVFGWGFSRASLWYVRWPGMTFAAMTLFATPIDGGHYLSDVLAGCAIAAISLWIASRAIHVDLRRRTARGEHIRSSPSRHSHAASAR